MLSKIDLRDFFEINTGLYGTEHDRIREMAGLLADHCDERARQEQKEEKRK